MSKVTINERSQQILKALITRYIRDGQPIGSKTIAEDVPGCLSPATIRNIMSDLEQHGYVSSPHTSAGRVPTILGYRFFVDSILKVQHSFDEEELYNLQQQLVPHVSDQELVESASSLISKVTQLTGIVTIPRREKITFRHIEFLPLSDNQILVILVLNQREVQNLIIHTDKEYTLSELQQAANFLMSHYTGKDFLEIRQILLNEMHEDHRSIDNIMHTVFDTAEKNLQKQQEDYVIAGESNLLNMAQETGVRQLQLLFDAFSRKHDILHLLDQCIHTDGIQIFIGQESGYDIFDDCSLITAPYTVDNKILGVLGVIGPTRIDYERVISVVNVTAKLLGAALKDRNTSND